MRNLRLDICYDGTRYRGWQRLTGVEGTIQGKLETVLSRILEEPIEVSGSGRTDAGVHAAHQIANFHCQNPMPAEKILEQLRRYLPEDIGIYSCEEAAPRFHARLNAAGKTYRYRIWNSEEPCVFLRRYVWCMPEKLDVEAMNRAAALLLGKHDFTSFKNQGSQDTSPVRTLTEAHWVQDGDLYTFTITGDGFLYRMVRNIVGCLVRVGTGTWSREDFARVLAARNRKQAGMAAPPQGLYLMHVSY